MQVERDGGFGSGLAVVQGQRVLPMPPTTGRWNRADPNTVLRVLYHRRDNAANGFLKKMFQHYDGGVIPLVSTSALVTNTTFVLLVSIYCYKL